MKEEQLYALIELEMRGTLSESQARTLADWVGQGSHEETTYQEVRSILEITQEGISVIDTQTDQSWMDLQAMLGASETAESAPEEVADAPVIPLKRSRTRIYGIAAAIILLVMVGIFVAIPGDNSGNSNGQTFATAHSQVTQVNLPDGSQVTLNSESQLDMPGDFNDELRRVKLEGEAFFDVEKNKEKPFIIEVLGTETRVLGTSFNISAYPATEQVIVSVVTGRVEFSPVGSTNKLVLNPDEAGRFDLKTKTLFPMGTVAKEDAAWKDGKLVFRKVPFGNALERLEKHYDLEFSVDPELENELLTTTVDFKKDTEEDLIGLLQATFQAKIEKTGKQVKIMK